MISGEMKALPRPRVRALGMRDTRRCAGRPHRGATRLDLERTAPDRSLMADAHGRVVPKSTGRRRRSAPGSRSLPIAVLPSSVPRLFQNTGPGNRSPARSHNDASQPFLDIGSYATLRADFAALAASSALGVPLRWRRTIREPPLRVAAFAALSEFSMPLARASKQPAAWSNPEREERDLLPLRNERLRPQAARR